jgi:hypothetical protein
LKKELNFLPSPIGEGPGERLKRFITKKKFPIGVGGEVKIKSVIMENKKNATKMAAIAVSLAGISVMLGWLFNIHLLTSISPAWVSMKISTAICFFLSGVSLYYMAKAREGDSETAQIVLL